MTDSWQSHEGSLAAGCASSAVAYRVLTPPHWARSESLPLLQVLHGAGSGADVLMRQLPEYERLWRTGELPRVVVACASTPTVGGAYIDQPDGPAWERLVAEEFPEHIREQFGTSGQLALVGSSMGGYGALKVAFRRPARYAAVAAISPALFPTTTRTQVPPRNRLAVLSDLRDAMAGYREDDDLYAHNDVATVLSGNAEAVRSSGLRILVDCGDDDAFFLQDGNEFLHRRLWDLDVAHEYHLVLGADHIGPAAPARLRRAIAFATASFLEPDVDPALPAEHTAEALAAMREAVRLRQRAAGLDTSVSRRHGRLAP